VENFSWRIPSARIWKHCFPSCSISEVHTSHSMSLQIHATQFA
jgi:hypothetical protein